MHNLGIPGANSREGLARLPRVLSEQPDHVVIFFGMNDALNSKKLLGLAEFKKNLTAMVTLARKSHVKSVLLVTIQPIDPAYLAERHPQHPQRERLQEHLAEYDQAVREVARQTEAILVDWRARFLAESPGDTIEDAVADRRECLNLCVANSGTRNGNHPTAQGYRFLADEVAQGLRGRVKMGEEIACFGDSLTHGSQMKGQGTATEQTYPAYLHRMLSEDPLYDVVVYGDSSAGVVAAVQAARMGKRVVLISPHGKVGGLTGSGLGATDIPEFQSVGGISREFYQRIFKYYSDPAAWPRDKPESYFESIRHRVFTGRNLNLKMMWVFEPSVARLVFESMLEEAGVVVIRNERLDLADAVRMVDGSIHSIRMESGREIRGRVFIDTSYEGDLMAKAGVSYFVGREPNSQYGETLNGILPGPVVGKDGVSISPYVVENDPDSGYLPYLLPDTPGKRGEGDRRIQAYCYRMTLTDAKENMRRITKPANYNPLWFEHYARLLAIDPHAGINSGIITVTPMPNRKIDINHCDFVGANTEWPEAGYERRAEIAQMHKDYALGKVWFLQNDPRVPQPLRDKMAKYGLPKDEFTDTDNFPYQIYVREARRMQSDYVMIELDIIGKRACDDSVGVGSYWFDSHVVSRFVDAEDKVREEGGFWKKRYNYPISYRSLRPRKHECTNLLVPVCLSASHAAYGSIRMEPVYMVLGQSAGTAAAIAIENGSSVQDVDYTELRKQLWADGQILKP
ncbi:FAD-dependent oxidoreductase [Rubinisphaera italica]|uniref:FAD-dependent oxidoreductase n=1 Tax=Rubinisphaera italica TaxID=2527969 RepID=UPI0013EF27F6|nr:FAD-dependent oxidoreductase [Rubinisphaera italica]